jgi:hypothetical protein
MITDEADLVSEGTIRKRVIGEERDMTEASSNRAEEDCDRVRQIQKKRFRRNDREETNRRKAINQGDNGFDPPEGQDLKNRYNG